MRLREYKLQAYREADATLLEDRLHSYIHAENILNGDAESSSTLDREKSSSSKGLVKKMGAENLYGVLKLNEFDVEEKKVRRIRSFSRNFPWIFRKERFPTHDITLLLSGEETPLIAIHDFLINNRDYLVLSAKTFDNANWNGNTELVNKDLENDYCHGIETYITENFGKGIQITFSYRQIKNTKDITIGISLNGPIKPIHAIREKLKIGFMATKITEDEISYS